MASVDVEVVAASVDVEVVASVDVEVVASVVTVLLLLLKKHPSF